jgi:hypothetical protein
MSIELKLVGTGFKDFTKALQDKSQSISGIAGSSISVVSNAEYSGFVDQGTRYMNAQPFFQDTIESHSLEEIGPDFTIDKIREYARKLASEMQGKAPIDTGYLQSNIEVVE